MSDTTTGVKQAYIPAKIWQVPAGNNFAADTSLYSNTRRVETPNLVAFWARDFGQNPVANIDPKQQFDIAAILKEVDRFYGFYTDSLKFIEKGRSVSDTYKSLLFVTNSTDATAFGGGADNKVGILWVTPGRISKAPFGAVAHELAHAFQYFIQADGHWGFTSAPEGSRGQAIFEMTAQYMLWQVYPAWMTFENYHLKNFMQQTHYAFLHEKNQYCSPYVLEYWSFRHGREFMGKLWRSAQKGEDPVATYKRITGIDQRSFNNEIFDASRRFVTWDLPRIAAIASPYANQHESALDQQANGWYRISAGRCPQNYGYNAIRLDPAAGAKKLKLRFKGIAGAEGFRKINTGKAGWRYGFAAVLKDGSRVYSEAGAKSNGTLVFRLPPQTAHLWLVVSGAPTEHWEHLTDGKDENDEQWPYEIKLEGAKVNGAFLR